MKKTYQKPEALVELTELEQFVCASIFDSAADPDNPVLGRESFIFSDEVLIDED